VQKLQTLVYDIIEKRRKRTRTERAHEQPSDLRLDDWQTSNDATAAQQEKSDGKDLLDLLLEAKDDEGDGEGFSNQQIMEEVMTFMVSSPPRLEAPALAHALSLCSSLIAVRLIGRLVLLVVSSSLQATRRRASLCRGRFICSRSTRRSKTSSSASWSR
jgi:hypothetical protein